MPYTKDQSHQIGAAIFAAFQNLPYEEWHPRVTNGEWRAGSTILADGEWLYRPKPTPKRVPWSKPEHVPPVCYLRTKGRTSGFSMILSANEFGVSRVVRYKVDPDAAEVQRKPWSEMRDSEYSTDLRTWSPCEVEA